MPISKTQFLDAYQKSLDDCEAAAFVGAGLSVPAGFVGWKELMREIANDVGLDIDEETDLIAIAQYHVNHTRARAGINRKLIEEYTKDCTHTPNHTALAALPISTIWTTNYDHLLEDSLKADGKRVDSKVSVANLGQSKPKRDVVVYKMHGDISDPDKAVLTKDDYERFNDQGHRQLFSIQLQGDLVSKTFMFLGFSFTDPNIGYILGRVRSLVGQPNRTHYWITRDESKNGTKLDAQRQTLRIEDLKTYGIRTVLLDDYLELTDLLLELKKRVNRRSVFISGSASDFSPLGKDRALSLVRKLSGALIENGFNVVSGYGHGIGDAVVSGALEAVYRDNKSHLDERTTLRPFPQFGTEEVDRQAIWSRYREELVGKARAAIFLFGNKVTADGSIVPADGVHEEFRIAVANGLFPIPIGATGHVAQVLWAQVIDEVAKFYGTLELQVVSYLRVLGAEGASDDQLISAVVAILKLIAPK